MSLPDCVDLCEIIVIVILPPIGVLLSGFEKHIDGKRVCLDACINLVLVFFLYIPGNRVSL